MLALLNTNSQSHELMLASGDTVPVPAHVNHQLSNPRAIENALRWCHKAGMITDVELMEGLSELG
ncbi:MAG: hypothetical protein A2580_18240 [Hydrogenophilales bacterium RIFOXYD1_FULL_62_11]|nr:MAG: hypothetical protein A2580_18240 [Hydrogenophilales bacterium RIFOXYD1_FULL_62_11]